MTDDPIVTLQSRRGDRWQDFTFGPLSAARRHVEQNTPGVWRVVAADGSVLVPPTRHTHEPIPGSEAGTQGRCLCGRMITLAEGEWRADWPPRKNLSEEPNFSL